jgi:dihydroflavonol-4-reductase
MYRISGEDKQLPLNTVIMRAFVTGGTGFVGANVARALIASGWSVRALARTGSDTRNLDGLDSEIVRGDLTDTDLVEKIRGCEAVFHVAAHYSLYRRDSDAVLRDNVEGTRNVLAAARTADVKRTVYTSSVSAIGVKHGGIADETHQASLEEAIGAYKRSKLLAEREAHAAAASGQEVVIVNPSAPLGPWDRKPTPTGDILVRFLNGRMPAIVDTGLNFADVADVAHGHLLAFERGRSGERYILGGENLTLHAFLERVGAIVGKKAPRLRMPHWLPLAAAFAEERMLAPLARRAPALAVDGVRMSREKMYYDAGKAMRELGYAPSPLDGAIRSAIEWFAANGYLPRRG